MVSRIKKVIVKPQKKFIIAKVDIAAKKQAEAAKKQAESAKKQAEAAKKFLVDLNNKVSKLNALVREDKEVKVSMNDWVDEHGHVINKYLYAAKHKYHLDLRNDAFNILKDMNRAEQESYAKVLEVELKSEFKESKVVNLLVRKIFN